MPVLTFIGTGAMGQALMRGLLASGIYTPSDLVLYSINRERLENLASELDARAATSIEDAVNGADIVLLAVKPHVLESAIEPLRSVLTPQQTVISVAAGLSTTRIEACFDSPVPVVRAMPNTPALVGEAATAICAGAYATPEHMTQARSIFSALGLCVETDEKVFDAVTGLSGSGPAYVFLFIEALADGGVRAGLTRDVALRLAAQTVLGAARMILETGDHPGVLKDRVASPGGTTIAAIHALESGAFRGVVMDAVMASANRSKELG